MDEENPYKISFLKKILLLLVRKQKKSSKTLRMNAGKRRKTSKLEVSRYETYLMMTNLDSVALNVI